MRCSLWRFRRTVLAAVASSVTVSVVVVSASAAPTTTTASNRPAAKKTYTIGYSGANLSNPSIAVNLAAVKAQGALWGWNVVATDAQFSASKQITDIDSLIARGVDAIILVPVNQEALELVLDRARKKGITVVGREGTGKYPWNVSFAGTDFDSAARAARYMASKLGKGADVAVIQGNPSTPLLANRNNGFAYGAAKYGLNIVDSSINFKDSADGARPIVDAWRAKYGSSLKGIFAYNDPSASAAASAAGGGFNPMIIGMNGTPEAIAAIKANQVEGTFDIQSAEQGDAMAYVTQQLLTQPKVAKCPAVVKVPYIFFTKKNVDQWIPFDARTKNAQPVAIATLGPTSFMLVGKAATQYRAKLKKRHLTVKC